MNEGRIEEHPVLLKFERGRKVTFAFEGKRLEAFEGETIAAALVASGVKVLGWSQKLHRPRGFFCAIGKCSSCLMRVDGVPNVRACTTPVKDGLGVERQEGKPKIL